MTLDSRLWQRFLTRKKRRNWKKATAIEAKVAKLSAQDRAIYTEELARLAGNGLGGLLKATDSGWDSLNNSVDALQSAGQLLDAAGKLTEDASLQDVLNAAQNATNATGEQVIRMLVIDRKVTQGT
ncbi:MAG: hypothetical protein LBT14_04835 [Treponema sp.]|jgi:hypothetical protein|nr:hypothetical protein [Treponema sp.]